MNLIDLVAALKTRWDAASLGDSITGGIHPKDKVPNGTTMPYVTVEIPDDTVRFRTSISSGWHRRYNSAMVRLRLHHNAGLEAMGTLANLLESAFDGADLTAAGATFMHCQLMMQGIIPDLQHPNANLWVMQFDILWARAMRKTAV